MSTIDLSTDQPCAPNSNPITPSSLYHWSIIFWPRLLILVLSIVSLAFYSKALSLKDSDGGMIRLSDMLPLFP
ncbi:MAG: hypothetical protein M1827_006430, partial [Pycnora praestabilis]